MQVDAMVLTPWQTILMILAVAAGTALMRFLPFWLFPESQKTSPIIRYLGKVLPPAMIGLLVVYCLKDVDFVAAPYGAAELAAILLIVLLHSWKRNVLLSIGGGTAAYMLLIKIL